MRWRERQILLDIMHAWMLATMREVRTSIADDLRERSRALHSMGKKASSIWLMNKEALVQQGLRELGMTKEQLEAMRVGEIRQTIKDHRDNISRAATGTAAGAPAPPARRIEGPPRRRDDRRARGSPPAGRPAPRGARPARPSRRAA